MFEPMLNWLNDKLYPANWLGLYGSDDEGVTWAKLIQAPDSKATFLVPVWLDQNSPMPINDSVALA